MYSLWISIANEHFSDRKKAVVSHDSYKMSGQFDKLDKAQYAFVAALANGAPGTKVKLIGTVPEVVVAPKDEIAELKAKIAQLEGKAA